MPKPFLSGPWWAIRAHILETDWCRKIPFFFSNPTAMMHLLPDIVWETTHLRVCVGFSSSYSVPFVTINYWNVQVKAKKLGWPNGQSLIRGCVWGGYPSPSPEFIILNLMAVGNTEPFPVKKDLFGVTLCNYENSTYSSHKYLQFFAKKHHPVYLK